MASNIIEKTLLCPLCNKHYDVPLVLPYGQTICKQCAQVISNQVMRINTSESSNNLKKCLTEIDEKRSHLSNLIRDKEQLMHDHYDLIRHEIYLSTQSRIDELNRLCEQLIQETKNQEAESLDYVREFESRNESLMRDINELSEELEKLTDESNERVFNAKPTDNEFNEIWEKAQKLSSAFNDCTKSVKDAFYPDGKKLEFVESKQTLSTETICCLNNKRFLAKCAFKHPFVTVKELNGIKESVNTIAVLSNDTLVCSSESGAIKMYKTSSGECIKTLSGHTAAVCTLVVLPDDKLVSGSKDKSIKLWNTTTGECIRTLTGHSNGVLVLAVLSKGTLASGSADQTIKLWNVSDDISNSSWWPTSSCIRTLTGHSKLVRALAKLSDVTLASGSDDYTIKLWNTSTGACIRTLNGHDFDIYALAVLSDGTLVSGSWDNSIKLWNTTTGECIRTLIGHGYGVLVLAVLKNGTLVSGSFDRTIKLWNTSTAECISTLLGDTGTVSALVVLSDGTLVSGSFDDTIKLWK